MNLYDYWTEFCNPQKKFLFWHSHIMWKLEMNIRKKWKWSPELGKVNIIVKKYNDERNEFFDPTRFLEEFDSEKYFQLLEDRPHLLFSPRRHKKILRKPIPCIRG